jgi:hypothetical protein
MLDCLIAKQVADYADQVDFTPCVSGLNVTHFVEAVLTGCSFTWTNADNYSDTRTASKQHADTEIRENYNLSDPIFNLLAQGDAHAALAAYEQTIKHIITATIETAVDDTQQWPDGTFEDKDSAA